MATARGSHVSSNLGPENLKGPAVGLPPPTLNPRALPRLVATHVSGFRLASMGLRAWFAVAQGLFNAA